MKTSLKLLLIVFLTTVCVSTLYAEATPDTTVAKAPQIAPGGEKAKKPDAETLANIDLAKTPWLCESVGLSPAHAAFSRPRMMWANSFRFVPIKDVVEGDIVVERWVNEAPKDLAGKFVLIEVWATWCPPCRRSLPLLDYYHEKFKDDLVVISICETDEKALEEMKGPLKLANIKSHLAVDTNRRFADKLGVYGIPHVVILEPVYGAVMWEGMPTLPGYELDEKTIEKFIASGKKIKEAGKMPKVSPITFSVEKADPDKAPKTRSGEATW